MHPVFSAKTFYFFGVKKGDIALLLWRIPFDFVSAASAWFFAYALRPSTDLIPWVQRYFPAENLPLMSFFVPFAVFSALAFVFLQGFLGKYHFSDTFEPVREFFTLMFSVFIWGMLIVAWYALFRHELIFSRIILMQAMIFTLFLSFSTRLLLRLTQMLNWKTGKNQKRIVLFGSRKYTKELSKALKNDDQFLVYGSFGENELSHIRHVKRKMDELWCCDTGISELVLKKLQSICDEKHLLFRFAASQQSLFSARMEFALIAGIPLILALPATLTAWQRIIKRGFDIFVSFALLLILSPAFLLFALGIRLDSEGPVFFKSPRLGREGKPFLLWKFRSMVQNAEIQKSTLQNKNHRKGPLFKVKNDPRITRFGKFLRRFSLDELPNLINVFKGEMSLIGPRPHLPEEIKKYKNWQKRVLMMKPGITGLAQVSGRSDLAFEEEAKLDLYYMKNWSFWMDLKILLRTIGVVLSQKGAD